MPDLMTEELEALETILLEDEDIPDTEPEPLAHDTLPSPSPFNLVPELGIDYSENTIGPSLEFLERAGMTVDIPASAVLPGNRLIIRRGDRVLHEEVIDRPGPLSVALVPCEEEDPVEYPSIWEHLED